MESGRASPSLCVPRSHPDRPHVHSSHPMIADRGNTPSSTDPNSQARRQDGTVIARVRSLNELSATAEKQPPSREKISTVQEMPFKSTMRTESPALRLLVMRPSKAEGSPERRVYQRGRSSERGRPNEVEVHAPPHYTRSRAQQRSDEYHSIRKPAGRPDSLLLEDLAASGGRNNIQELEADGNYLHHRHKSKSILDMRKKILDSPSVPDLQRHNSRGGEYTRRRMLSRSPIRRDGFNVIPPLLSWSKTQPIVQENRPGHTSKLLDSSKVARTDRQFVGDNPSDLEIIKALRTIESLSRNVGALTVSISALRSAEADFDQIREIARRIVAQYCASRSATPPESPAHAFVRGGTSTPSRHRAQSVPEVLDLIDSAAEHFGLDLREDSPSKPARAHDSAIGRCHSISRASTCSTRLDNMDGSDSPQRIKFQTNQVATPYTEPADPPLQVHNGERGHEDPAMSMSNKPALHLAPLSQTPITSPPNHLRRLLNKGSPTTPPPKRDVPQHLHVSHCLAQSANHYPFSTPSLAAATPQQSHSRETEQRDGRARRRDLRTSSPVMTSDNDRHQHTGHLMGEQDRRRKGLGEPVAELENAVPGPRWHTAPSTPPSPSAQYPLFRESKADSPLDFSPQPRRALRRKHRPVGERVAGAVEWIEKQQAANGNEAVPIVGNEWSVGVMTLGNGSPQRHDREHEQDPNFAGAFAQRRGRM